MECSVLILDLFTLPSCSRFVRRSRVDPDRPKDGTEQIYRSRAFLILAGSRTVLYAPVFGVVGGVGRAPFSNVGF